MEIFNKLHYFLFCLGLDLFEKMVPMAVQQSVSAANSRKSDTVNRLIGSMREATNLCNGSVLLHIFALTRVY